MLAKHLLTRGWNAIRLAPMIWQNGEVGDITVVGYEEAYDIWPTPYKPPRNERVPIARLDDVDRPARRRVKTGGIRAVPPTTVVGEVVAAPAAVPVVQLVVAVAVKGPAVYSDGDEHGESDPGMREE